MRDIFNKAIISFLIAMIAPMASAQSAEDKAAAQAVIDEFSSAMNDNDMRSIIALVPQPMLEEMAEQANVPIDAFVDAVAVSLEATMGEVTFLDFEMDMDTATGGVSEAGRAYFVVPTESTFNLPDVGTVRTRSQTLAFEDEGEWWVLRVENVQSKMMLADLYPDLARVEMMQETMEIIK